MKPPLEAPAELWFPEIELSPPLDPGIFHKVCASGLSTCKCDCDVRVLGDACQPALAAETGERLISPFRSGRKRGNA